MKNEFIRYCHKIEFKNQDCHSFIFSLIFGSIGIQPNGIQPTFIKIEFVVAGGGFYSYYNHLHINLDKEREVCKKTKFYGNKRNKRIFKEMVEVQIVLNFTSTEKTSKLTVLALINPQTFREIKLNIAQLLEWRNIKWFSF